MTRTQRSQRAQRPRSLVTHLVRLTGADPVTARMLINSSGRAAIKRLAIKPAVKARTRTTITGRHVIVAAPVLNKKTGEVEVGQKSVRRRGRSSRRREGTVVVHRWTPDQALDIFTNMKPRKAEYQEIQQAAVIAGFEVIRTQPTLRRLPRNRRWSKRRNRR